MDLTAPLLRPARRSVLLSSALLVPFGLAGCDPDQVGPPEEPAGPAVTLVPMTTEESLLPEQPLREGSWNLSPTDDPATTGLAVDRHGATAKVLASSVVGAEHRQQLWSSSDLADWTAAEATGIDREIAAFGGGVVASAVNGRTVALWDLADDGAATALTSVEVPDGAEWEARAASGPNGCSVLRAVGSGV